MPHSAMHADFRQPITSKINMEIFRYLMENERPGDVRLSATSWGGGGGTT